MGESPGPPYAIIYMAMALQVYTPTSILYYQASSSSHWKVAFYEEMRPCQTIVSTLLNQEHGNKWYFSPTFGNTTRQKESTFRRCTRSILLWGRELFSNWFNLSKQVRVAYECSRVWQRRNRLLLPLLFEFSFYRPWEQSWYAIVMN